MNVFGPTNFKPLSIDEGLYFHLQNLSSFLMIYPLKNIDTLNNIIIFTKRSFL